MLNKTENLTQTRLEDFEPGQTLYISKMKSGFMIALFCEFIGFKTGGFVVATVLSVDPHYERKWEVGEEVSAPKRKCYLWGIHPEVQDTYPHSQPVCHWYDKKLGWK